MTIPNGIALYGPKFKRLPSRRVITNQMQTTIVSTDYPFTKRKTGSVAKAIQDGTGIGVVTNTEALGACENRALC